MAAQRAAAFGNRRETSKPLSNDRAALSAISAKKHPEYARPTLSLLAPGAFQLLVTLEFDESNYEGPPFSIMPDEVLGHWPGLQRIDERDDTDNRSSKFHDAGVERLLEVVWKSSSSDG